MRTKPKPKKRVRKLTPKQYLLAAKRAILREPRQFVMDSWFANRNASLKYTEINSVPNCGTAACIGGWICSIHYRLNPAKTLKKVDLLTEDSWKDAGDIACRIIRQESAVADDLFIIGRWPNRFINRWDEATTAKQRARVAADRINYFIEHELEQ